MVLTLTTQAAAISTHTKLKWLSTISLLTISIKENILLPDFILIKNRIYGLLSQNMDRVVD